MAFIDASSTVIFLPKPTSPRRLSGNDDSATRRAARQAFGGAGAGREALNRR